MQFVTNQAGVAVAFGDEDQTPFNGRVDLVQLLLSLPFAGTALFAQLGDLGLELGDKRPD